MTLNRSIGGSESDDRDMSAYVRAADAVRDAFDCLVEVVHHSGPDASRPRGHTSLVGAADVQISVKRDTAANIIATVEFMRDGEAGAVFTSRLVPVEVGRDEDGEPITSCVVESVHENGRPAAVKPAKVDRTSKVGRIALRAFGEAMDKAVIPPANERIPHGIKAVTIEDWRANAISRGVSPSEKPDSARAAFRRAMQELTTSKRVAVWDAYAWSTSERDSERDKRRVL